MPSYSDDISGSDGGGEVSAISNRLGSQVANLNLNFSQMMSRVDRMISLMGKMRDYTQDEIRDVRAWKDEISSLAATYRSFYGDSAKGMNDFSVVMKKAEDDIESYQKSIIGTKKEVESLTNSQKKLTDILFIKKKDKRDSALKDYFKDVPGSETWNRKKLLSAADTRNTELTDYIRMAKAANEDVAKDKQAKETQYQKLQKSGIMARRKMEEEEERRSRRSNRPGILQMAGDMNIPGVSQVSTVARYAQAYGENGGMMGALGGGLLGAGIAAGAYTMYQGYKAYNTAHQMAPLARTLSGQMGDASVGARKGAISAYGGYGGVENMAYLTSLNRSLGSRGGASNLRTLTDISNSYGISREESGGLAGALYSSGGATPEGAGKDLSKILSEGIKAGMDRAKITEFAQHTLSIQQDLFTTIGQNNAQNVSQSLSQLMRGYKGDANNFFRSGAMRAVTGLDGAVKNAAASGDGLMMRAFGFGMGSNKGTAGEEYYNAVREMEGGIFSGSADDQINKLKRIVSQVDSDYGGNTQGADLHMKENYGIGLNQMAQLREVLKGAGGPVSDQQKDVLRQISEGTKDPMQKLLDLQARSNENLARLAGDKGLGTIIAIDQGLAETQEKALGFLEIIANAVAGEAGSGKTEAENIEESWKRNVSSKSGLGGKAKGYFDYITDSQTWSGFGKGVVDNMQAAGDMVLNPSRFAGGITGAGQYRNGKWVPTPSAPAGAGKNDVGRVADAVEKQTQLLMKANSQREEQIKATKAKELRPKIVQPREKGRAG